MSRYHIYTDARHPNGTLATGSLLSVYGDAAMNSLIALYADETSGTTLENPYTVPSAGICSFWVEDVTPWVLAENDTTPKPIYVNINAGEGTVNVKDYGAVGSGQIDDVAAIQAAIDSCGATGGVVVVPKGTYAIASNRLHLPPNLNGRLIISGYGATFKLSGMYPVFYLFKGADNDTFRHITLEGFTIDATGCVINGALLVVPSDDTNINIEDIVIRDILITNITSPEAPAGAIGLSLKSSHGVAGGAWHHVQDILVENLRQEGGTGLMYIAGGTAYDENILVDRITVRNCYHDTGVVATSGGVSLNAQFGGKAKGGRLLVDGFYGAGASDVGIEVDSFDDAVIRNATIENSFGYGFYTTAFSTYLNPDQATIRFENCTYKRTAGGDVWTAPAYMMQQQLEAYQLCNHVYDGCSFVNTSGERNDNCRADGLATSRGAEVKSITIRDFTYSVNGMVLPADIYGGAINIDASGSCPTVIDGYHFHLDGSRAAGGGAPQYYALILDGPDTIADISNIIIDYDVTNLEDSGARGITLGGFGNGAASVQSASISNVNVLSISDDPHPVIIRNYAPISGRVHIFDCDFTAAPATSYEFQILASAEKVFIDNHAWRNKPNPAAFTTKPTLTIDSVSTSATLPELVTGAAHGMVVGDWMRITGITELETVVYYQVVSTDAATHFVVAGATTGTDTGFCQPCYTNRNGYDQDVVVSGGTVTAIALSTNAGADFTVTGLTAGIFRLRGGDIIHITNSSAPTTTRIPRP